MEIPRKNFIPRNDTFVCEYCGFQVGAAQGTFRNHCPQCLTSKHVDQDVPGDRAASCGGLMPTVNIDGTDPDKLDLIQRCQTCGKQARNRTAPDDNKEKIFSLMALRA